MGWTLRYIDILAWLLIGEIQLKADYLEAVSGFCCWKVGTHTDRGREVINGLSTQSHRTNLILNAMDTACSFCCQEYVCRYRHRPGPVQSADVGTHMLPGYGDHLLTGDNITQFNRMGGHQTGSGQS